MSLVLDTLRSFNDHDIKYCVFKEFDLIEKTIVGDEDIDILIDNDDFSSAHRILIDSGYYKCKYRKMNDGIMFYLGYDQISGTPSLLHIHTKLRIGTKREKQLRWNDLEKYILKHWRDDNPYCIKVIAPEEEICLLFIRMILRKKPNQDDYSRLSELMNKVNINDVFFSDSIKQMIGAKETIDLYKYINSPIFGTNEERNCINRFLSKGLLNKISILNRMVYSKVMHVILALRKKLNYPEKPIRTFGSIFAVVGVDGCGKSTLISNIKNDPFLKWTGVRVIYGGNNNYWIPGLKKEKKGVIWGVLRSIDRRLRVVSAWLTVLKGKIVVFDRYFYDDYIGYKTRKKTKKTFGKRVYDCLLHSWIGIKPRLTFFLDIDPDTAYERKQDYSYDLLCENIKNYRDCLVRRKEVILLDATHTPDEIKKTVICHILKKRAPSQNS